VDNLRTLAPTIAAILPRIGLALFILGIIDNYLLTRYGGRLNRGFTVWRTGLSDDQSRFLLNVREDVVDRRKVALLRTKTSFVRVQDREALIRYSNPYQRTSWPLVGYVDLSASETELEYRLSLVMLLGTVLLALSNIIVASVLSIAFVASWYFETTGLRQYLSDKADRYFVLGTSQTQNKIS
jgi:hypothetical protein